MKKFLKFSALGCGGFVGLSVLFLLFAVISADPNTDTSYSSSQSPDPSNNQTTEIASNRIEKGDRAITIDSAQITNELTSDNEFIESVPGPLVIVNFTSENIGNKTGDFAFSQYTIEDSKGRVYDEVTALEYSMWRDAQGYQARVDEYFPGESRKDIAAFRVAPDANGFQFSWKGSSVPITVSGK